MNLSILNLASALAAHASARQEVIAGNVAHADTPGYRARDIADFASILDGTPGLSARMTRPGHIAFGADPRGFEPREAAAFGAETPNGNSVSLEDQMLRAAAVRQEHDLALGVYSKTLDILRTTVTRR
ncbi:MAG TPA: FlgB family protein [Amaricoccus sp.]|nr:FlgB family protein [Amaricoccus sp.]